MTAAVFVAGLLLSVPVDDTPSTPPPVVAEGREWVWNATLGFYAPAGEGWQYDVDREVFWRLKTSPPARSPWSAPLPTEPQWRQDADGKWWRFDRARWLWVHTPANAVSLRQDAVTGGPATGFAFCVGGG